MSTRMTIGGKEINVQTYDHSYAAYNVPYAHYHGRFEPTSLFKFEDMDASIDCSTRGPVFPQSPNRLSKVMGHVDAEKHQSETAFNLNIFSQSDFKDKPVLLWIHGGGWLTGGGALPWYDGTVLTETQDMVVVTVNYRIGALGAMYQENHEMYNFGLHDIIQALTWVHRYIHHFGGDPERITVGGQSAGAWYTVALLGMTEANQYIHNALIQSFPGEIQPLDNEQGAWLTSRLMTHLNEQDIYNVPIDSLLKAQENVMKDVLQTSQAVIPTTFIPIMDDVKSKEEFIAKAAAQSAGKVNMLAWFAEHETTAFSEATKDDSEVHTTTYQEFYRPTDELIRRFNAGGSQTEFITIEGGNHQLGATHCYDLPLMFGTFEAWDGAPMLQNLNDKDLKHHAKQLQNKVGQFVHS